MRTQTWIAVLGCATLAAGAGKAVALDREGFALSVLVNGEARPEYPGRDRTYIEAVRGREYTLSLTNPLPYRVAVALSVDGLNTIDARRTSPGEARKWVIGPYETIEISGWQVNANDARRFLFTGERHSYGAYLGATGNLGVIEAVFYRERLRYRRPYVEARPYGDSAREGELRKDAAAPRSAAPSAGLGAARQEQKAEGGRLSDEYAATGIGARDDHQVRTVDIELETTPSATLRLRYEYRSALVKLGILPARPAHRALDRRERASGFSPGYCPDPSREEW